MRVLFAMLCVLAMTGCNAVYKAFGTDADTVHDVAVQKVSDYAEAAVNRKIEKSVNLSEEGKQKLKAEVSKLKYEIIEKIAEIKNKTKITKEGESSAEGNVDK